MLNLYSTISRVQSATFIAALRGFVINAVTLFVIVTGVTVNMETVEHWLTFTTTAIPLLLAFATPVYNLWEFRKVMKGRVNAEQKIEPLPWREEVKTLIKKVKP